MKLITNRHRNIALMVHQGRTYIHCLLITSTAPVAIKLTEEELVADWSEVMAYDLRKAVVRFQDMADMVGAEMTQSATKLLQMALDHINEEEEGITA
jgi:hypothetical protein